VTRVLKAAAAVPMTIIDTLIRESVPVFLPAWLRLSSLLARFQSHEPYGKRDIQQPADYMQVSLLVTEEEASYDYMSYYMITDRLVGW